MQNLDLFVRKYPFSLVCVVLIWYLSIWFMPPEFPELEQVAFVDKWTHLVMYGGFCSTIWWEYLRHHDKLNGYRLLLLGWLTPVLMSGCLELIQEYCTENRAGEWLDLCANITGCTIGACIGLAMYHFRKRIGLKR